MSNTAIIDARITAIREALAHGGEDGEIAVRLGTTAMAVRVLRKGLGGQKTTASAPSEGAPVTTAPAVQVAADGVPATGPQLVSAVCPWRGRYVAIDGANVAGWGQKKGEPRLAQVLAVCRYFSENGVRFSCWFDATFRWAVKRFSERDAAVLDRILKEEPQVFKQSPAGGGVGGDVIKADVFVLRDVAGVPDGLVLSGDLFRHEAETDPEAFGWVKREPWRFIRGVVAGNGDVLLGTNGEVRIPVADNPETYI